MNRCPLIDESILTDQPSRSSQPALIWNSGDMTHGELRHAARRFGGKLQQLGIGPGDRIAICLPKCAEFVQAILGTLAAGAAYVPLAPTTPAERICRTLRHAEVRLLLTTSAVRERCLEISGDEDVIPIEVVEPHDTGRALDPWTSAADDLAPTAVDMQQLASLYYTSGSTGSPKAVMRSRRNLWHFIHWATQRFGFRAADRFAHLTPLHFALSTLDLFGALHAGASLFLIDEKSSRFPAAVTRALQDRRTTILCCAPTALSLICGQQTLQGRDLSELRLVLFGGESMPLATLRGIMPRLPDVQFVALYGSTEADACFYHSLAGLPPANQSRLPLGIPSEHLEVTLRDEKGQPVEPGQTGEIYVAGPTVLPGYWRQPVLTAACRFDGRDDSYRTGDFGCQQDDGTLHFRGRQDQLVKIRGQRVELGEVEAWLAEHPEVRQAAVLVSQPDDVQATLVAFITPAAAGVQPSVASLDQHCRRRLPAYATPARFLVHQSLPTTSTGKIDRQALQSLASI